MINGFSDLTVITIIMNRLLFMKDLLFTAIDSHNYNYDKNFLK